MPNHNILTRTSVELHLINVARPTIPLELQALYLIPRRRHACSVPLNLHASILHFLITCSLSPRSLPYLKMFTRPHLRLPTSAAPQELHTSIPPCCGACNTSLEPQSSIPLFLHIVASSARVQSIQHAFRAPCPYACNAILTLISRHPSMLHSIRPCTLCRYSLHGQRLVSWLTTSFGGFPPKRYSLTLQTPSG